MEDLDISLNGVTVGYRDEAEPNAYQISLNWLATELVKKGIKTIQIKCGQFGEETAIEIPIKEVLHYTFPLKFKLDLSVQKEGAKNE